MTILNLSHELAVLEVSGNDAATYLQGQLTNDIHELATQPWQLSAHLNHKGRILANFIITRADNNKYYLISDREIINKVLPRLKLFVLRSKVTLNILEVSIYLTDTPIDNGHNLSIAADNYLTITKTENQASISDNNQWHKFLVTNGLPIIYSMTQEKIIPQQVNLELLGGVNFKKGCYTGQEIVARTHYLGKVKRRMVRFSSNEQPQIGQTIVSPQLDNQETGFVVDYYQDAAQYIGLASVQLDCIDNLYLDIENKHHLICTLLNQ